MAFNSGQSSSSNSSDMLSVEITKATIKTLESANKTLRFAKANSNCGLMFQHVSDRHQVNFVAYSGASFATRKDCLPRDATWF